MNETMKTTIEEWAGDNNVIITDNQVNELIEAVEICSEIDMYSTGFTLGYKGKSDQDIEIEKLKSKLNSLELFIAEKGFNISYGDRYVKEYFMESISDSHQASRETTHYY